MEGFAILGAIVLIWILVGPIFGIIGMNNANRATRELMDVRAELRRLRRSLDDGAPEPTASQPETESGRPAPADAPTSVPPTRPERVAPPPKPARARPSRDWERLIAANWMVWAGGLALAFGGLFLVRVAIDAGYFGPLQRTIAAALLGGGLIAAAFRAQRLDTIKTAKNAVRFVPQVIAGAGLVSLYGAAIASGLMYQFVPPLVAFAIIAGISALAVALSMRFGPALAVPGLIGAYLAPLLTGAEGGSILPVLPYFALVTGAGLTLVRLTDWRWLTWILVVGAGFWGLVATASNEVITPLAVAAYALSLAGMGVFFGARDAKRDLVLPKNQLNPRYIAAGFGSSQLAAHIFWLLAGGLILLTGLQAGAGPVDAGALA